MDVARMVVARMDFVRKGVGYVIGRRKNGSIFFQYVPQTIFGSRPRLAILSKLHPQNSNDCLREHLLVA